jgi:putative tryptophan/tyrosine transport system substrate-binding protein
MNRREVIAGLAGTAVWPVFARAQRAAIPVIGFLSGWSSKDSMDVIVAFRRGLAETGYIEGKNIGIEFRWMEGHFDRVQAMLEDLVQRQVAAIVIANTTAAGACRKGSN